MSSDNQVPFPPPYSVLLPTDVIEVMRPGVTGQMIPLGKQKLSAIEAAQQAVTPLSGGVSGILGQANGGNFGAPGSMSVAGHSGAVNTLNSSSTAIRSYRITHFAKQALTNARLVYANWSPVTSTNAETGPGNSNTVTAGLEYNGVTYQVTWNNATSVVIPNGGTAPPSDPIPLDIPTGATFFERVCITTSGSTGLSYYLRNTVDSFVFGSDATTATGAMSSVDTQVPAQNAYAAVAILGSTASAPPSVLIIGDSIGSGTGDLIRAATDIATNPGYPSRALGDLVPWTNFSCSGATLAQFNTPTLTFQRKKVYSAFKYCWLTAGTNDIQGGASLAAVQASYTALAAAAAARGQIVYASTIVPRVTSTDGYRTAANQTPIASESVRLAVNAWLRSVPSIFAGVFDIAVQVEVDATNTPAINGGRWAVKNSPLVTSTATAGAGTSLTDTTQTWGTNAFQGISVVITSGTGAGQTNIIVSNTATVLTVNSAWSTNPDATSHYVIMDTPTLDGIHPNPSTSAVMAAGVPAAATFV